MILPPASRSQVAHLFNGAPRARAPTERLLSDDTPSNRPPGGCRKRASNRATRGGPGDVTGVSREEFPLHQKVIEKFQLEPHSRPRRFNANWVFSGVAFWYSPGTCSTGRAATEAAANPARWSRSASPRFSCHSVWAMNLLRKECITRRGWVFKAGLKILGGSFPPVPAK